MTRKTNPSRPNKLVSREDLPERLAQREAREARESSERAKIHERQFVELDSVPKEKAGRD